jgi:hypothetical protein
MLAAATAKVNTGAGCLPSTKAIDRAGSRIFGAGLLCIEIKRFEMNQIAIRFILDGREKDKS